LRALGGAHGRRPAARPLHYRSTDRMV